MRQFIFLAALTAVSLSVGLGQEGPYKVLKKGESGRDGRLRLRDSRFGGPVLYVARSGATGARINVFNLDTLEPVGEIPNVSAHGAVISTKSGHGFASSKPVTMFDSKTLAVLKTIDVEGNPDGMMYDPSSDRVYVLSHREPHVTAINAADGSIAGTVNIGGAPEQAASDEKGHIYIDVEDKENVAVLDARTLMVTGHYRDLTGKGGVCAGLALDVKNNVLFAACRNPQNMVVLSAADGKILTTLPLGAGTDGAVFNPATMEAFSSQGDGTLTIVKEKSPTAFDIEQNLTTMASAKTMALDAKTGNLYLIAAEFGPAPAGGRGRGPLVPDSFTILVVRK